MGQKVNPIGIRIGEFIDWKARWFANKKDFRALLLSDITLRRLLLDKLKNAGVTDIVIERLPKTLTIHLLVTRPGMVIGRGGAGTEELKALIRVSVPERPDKLDIVVEEVKEPELSARLVANRIVSELERRLPARRVVGRTIERVMAAGASGIKVVLAGRIGGAEIARRQRFKAGSVPTQTLRADIDYAQQPALLKRGYVGVKVWIHRKAKG